MHIADMTMFYAPASGGVRTYLDAKHRRLMRYPGVRHSLLIPGARSSHHDDIYQVPAPPVPFGNGYRFPWRVSPWRTTLQALKPDLIEAGAPYLTAWAALDARRQLDVPVIGFYHSDLPMLVRNRIGQWMGSSARAYISKLYSHFDRVLAPSQAIADTLQAMGVGQVHVQPLGVDLQAFHPRHRDPSLKHALGLGPDTRLLIFAGRGSREKNLNILLQCMQHLGNRYHLLLVGSHMPSHRPANVSVIGHFCPPGEVARLLASADAFVHAGDQETFGLVVLEAMACGTAVVAVDAGAFSEIIPCGCGVLCEANRPQAMACAVNELFRRDPRAMGQAGRDHVERCYSWDMVMAGLLGHYRTVLGHLPARAHG